MIVKKMEDKCYDCNVEENIVKEATNNNMEPNGFSVNDGFSAFGVHSDTYSYLDMSSDELSAKGNGGSRQLYNYADLNQTEVISTPEETYKPDKIDETSVAEYEKNRSL